MPLTDLEDLLRQATGLDAATLGASIIERAVQQRVEASALDGVPAYVDHVRACAEEFQELIEATVVPETWFFRDREAFVALGKLAGKALSSTGSPGVLRLLSLPCSSGEEPYSIAMALLEAGLTPNQFSIDAMDISARALERAHRALYGRNSFRGEAIDFRARWFSNTVEGYELVPAVRNQVMFQQVNLFDGTVERFPQPYDFVFCRNLLIYFDRPTQSRAVAILSKLLSPNGFIFVGPAEAPLFGRPRFVSAKFPLAFAFHKAASDAGTSWERPAILKFVPKPERVPRPAQSPTPRPWAPPVVPTPIGSLARKRVAAGPDLVLARRLADEGRLLECTAICEACLRLDPDSVEAFYLMGLVRDAAGDPEMAAHHYRKVLYLNPHHYEALVHLAYLVERSGDLARARVLHNRAGRLKQKGANS